MPAPSSRVSATSTTATDADSGENSGKIEFKKPVKRQSEEGNPSVLGASSSKKAREAMQRKQTSSRAVKDNNLLSFEDDEDT